MSPEVLRDVVNVATFIVIAASAVAALIQLRQVRSSNQLRALLAMQANFDSPEMQEALRFVQFELPQRLEESAFRAELVARGFVDPQLHPELRACNWFEALGAMFKHDLVDENAFMEIFARLVIWYWESLSGVVALMRRNRSQGQYHNFEYLTIRARDWVSAHPAGIFPKDSVRLPVADPWLEVDAARDIKST
jgi:hypothetical protein